MNGKTLHFFCSRENWFGPDIAVYLHAKTSAGEIAIPTESVVFKILTREEREKQEGRSRQPFLHLDPESAQRLMDELFSCGVRPSEGSGSIGQLAAVHAHLKDMRQLVAKAHGVEMK